MKLYNTLTREVSDFIPIEDGKVKIYTCGPTVYHYAHIGNLRNYIMQDVLVKAFTYLGFQVNRVMNITDVGHLTSDSDSGEDKMLKGAKRENKTVMEIANMYTDAFFQDFDKLNNKRPDVIAKATDHIDMYIQLIEKLLENGYAYKSNGNIYFDVSKLNDYYVLTNHKEDEMVVGVRDGVDFDLGKRNQADFVLWFTKSKFADQELKWDSPFGVGYPGWHIECSGISIKYLGENLDIHCGGIDNIFPHHTNEIAQSEAYLGHKWCNYWVHNEHLVDKDGKMSKSKGEFLTLGVLESKGYGPLDYRFFCLQSHYRRQLVFSYENMDIAKMAYRKLKNKIKSLDTSGEVDWESVGKYQEQFRNMLEDDLNTSMLITILYDVLKDDKINDKTKRILVEDFDTVLSLDLLKEDETLVIDDEILVMIEARDIAKKNKNYEEADKIREKLLSMGIRLIDTREGTTYERV